MSPAAAVTSRSGSDTRASASLALSLGEEGKYCVAVSSAPALIGIRESESENTMKLKRICRASSALTAATQAMNVTAAARFLSETSTVISLMIWGLMNGGNDQG